MRRLTISFSEVERDAILAGLALLSEAALLDPVIQEIRTNSGAHDGLTQEQLDALRERVNNLDDDPRWGTRMALTEALIFVNDSGYAPPETALADELMRKNLIECRPRARRLARNKIADRPRNFGPYRLTTEGRALLSVLPT